VDICPAETHTCWKQVVVNHHHGRYLSTHRFPRFIFYLLVCISFLQQYIIHRNSGPNIIQMYPTWTEPVNNSIILYTTNDIVDSYGQKGSPVTLKEPMGPNSTVSQLQFLQCSKSLVHQRGTADSRSRKLDPSSVHPSIHKTQSSWWRYDNSTIIPPDDTLIGSYFVCASTIVSSLVPIKYPTVVCFFVECRGWLVVYSWERQYHNYNRLHVKYKRVREAISLENH
jgi:hypothetical protein